MKQLKQGFTLVELIVSLTIGAIILLSVMSIFISSSDISNKIDISRAMQENTKNITEAIAEDIRQNGINICDGASLNCHTITSPDNYTAVSKLYVGANKYYLAKKTSAETYVEVGDLSDCLVITSECVFVKNGEPLSNSFVVFQDLQFIITNMGMPKVTISFVIKPSIRKGIKPKLIEETKLLFQTTITERIIKSN